MKLRPENFEPPYPAFTSALEKFPGGATMAMIGIQCQKESHREPADDRLAEKITANLEKLTAVRRVESCHFTDDSGYSNLILISYWDGWGSFQSWKERHDLLTIAGNRQIGLWLEAFACPASQMETSYSVEQPTWGMAPQCPIHLDPNHGYFGGMRDRITAAEDKGLPAEIKSWQGSDGKETLGRHITVKLPDNLCFIRTVQGWRDSSPDQKQDYIDSMMPVYEAGVEYLRNNPKDTNCLGAQLATLAPGDDQQIQTQTLAWFLGLSELERWAHEHPTHLAILTGMTDFAARYDNQINIVLGHEVYVIPKHSLHVEYWNCHAGTGFLPYFPSTKV